MIIAPNREIACAHGTDFTTPDFDKSIRAGSRCTPPAVIACASTASRSRLPAPAFEDRMPEIALVCPFGELDFACELRLQPDAVRQLVAREAVRPRTGSPNDGQFAEWTVGPAQRLERAQKFFDGFVGEAAPHSASEPESLFRIIVADQQRADTDA